MSPAEATFVRLYDAHYDEVHAFCIRRVGPDDADDAAAEVFAAAWRRIKNVGDTHGHETVHHQQDAHHCHHG